ncbi:MAG: phenylalanine--tRNA ligase subunit alpha [Bacteroidia bacterium]|nr:phenylalanine--tRNA ligase subunit alpha [Bacteroidia bacterium]
MQDRINRIIEEVEQFRPSDREQVEAFRVKYLGRKGILADLFAEMKTLQADQKKAFGQLVNHLKTVAEARLEEFNSHFESDGDNRIPDGMDLSLPGYPLAKGSRHPVSLTRKKILDIFQRIGFVVADGPEIEDDWHNFTALNFPENHPARDMQDTFFIRQDEGGNSIALRTHTSSVQIRVLEHTRPPVRILAPGRVYRNEAISARAHCFFHQVEGFHIDKNVSFADMKQTLLYFAREMFGSEAGIRLRPSYFPFTEPSAEMDVSCNICGGKGCNVCKHTGWLEIMGCGMVDPNVLQNCGISPDEFSGYAFGMGIERIAMLLYNVKDLRLFSENDVRFLSQFSREQ